MIFFNSFIKNKKSISVNWADKMKRKDNFSFFKLDEITVFLVGVVVFYIYTNFKFIFIVLVLMWYWFKIRYYEQSIIHKKRDIYNIQYDNAEGVDKKFADKKTAEDRKHIYYDIDQLKTQRQFLVDKFVIINLILLILLKS